MGNNMLYDLFFIFYLIVAVLLALNITVAFLIDFLVTRWEKTSLNRKSKSSWMFNSLSLWKQLTINVPWECARPRRSSSLPLEALSPCSRNFCPHTPGIPIEMSPSTRKPCPASLPPPHSPLPTCWTNYLKLLNQPLLLYKMTWHVEQARDASQAPSMSISFSRATSKRFFPIVAYTFFRLLSFNLKIT